jgi:hypothetical protein
VTVIATKTDAVSIVAGGHSFREVDHSKLPGSVIAVNGAAEHLRCKYAEVMTMDRLWLEHFWPKVMIHDASWIMHARDHALKHVPRSDIAYVATMEWLLVFRNHNSGDYPMSREPGVLNGSNSGACAINRAFQIWPRDLYLFGFDMCKDKRGNSYWYPPYPWVPKTGGTGADRLRRWAHEFDAMAAQLTAAGIRVTNVSSHSIIKSFRRVTPRELGVAR